MAFKYMRRECMYFPADRTKPKVESVSLAHINKVASEVFTGIHLYLLNMLGQPVRFLCSVHTKKGQLIKPK